MNIYRKLDKLEETELILISRIIKKAFESGDTAPEKISADVTNVIYSYTLLFGYLGKSNTESQIGITLPLQSLLDLSSEKGVIYNLLYEKYKKYEKIIERLNNSILSGNNPRELAYDIKRYTDLSTYQSMRIARTEQMRVYRDVSKNTMKSANITHWEWLSEPDACDTCKDNNGKIFPISVDMNTHPNCRCTMLPVL